MRSCEPIEIVTPKKVLLNGLWFGAGKPKDAIIWVHGLGSSAFSKLDIVRKLVDKNTAVMTFNNRGHDKVSSIARSVKNKIKKITLGGSAHEVFTDCADDIQGAINLARARGIKNIYLAGHSTGCQKSIFWASRKSARGVKGIILLAPVSDYAAKIHVQRKGEIERAAKAARALVAKGKKHQLLPAQLWPEHIDAQRFLSLYTPDSAEEIFTYAQPKKIPRLLQSVKLPILAILAEKDEFADRPAEKIAEWFERNTGANLGTLIVSASEHGFKQHERTVASAMKKWIKAQ